MAQQHSVGRLATAIHTDSATRDVVVVYHHTEVVRFNADRVILNSGGHRTATTKTRMNQTSNQYGLGYKLTQRNYQWFVHLPNGNTVEFADRMVFDRV